MHFSDIASSMLLLQGNATRAVQSPKQLTPEFFSCRFNKCVAVNYMLFFLCFRWRSFKILDTATLVTTYNHSSGVPQDWSLLIFIDY